MLHSTRSLDKVRESEAILKGLADDGGLFIFDRFHHIDINMALRLDYKEFSKYIFGLFFGKEFTKEEISEVVEKAYSKENFNDDIIGMKEFDEYAYLELFHGPTSAFKDMALTVLPHLIELAKKKNNINERTHIVVATSGDTGSATLSGFKGINDIDVTVLYPNNLVAPLQEAQMLYYSENGNQALAYDGNFDDCQKLVKEILHSHKGTNFSSANSINIGRLIPQVIYYFKAYAALVNDSKIKLGEKINISVPTGNFGDILAAYIAFRMGLPVNKLIVAANENNVLVDLINEGVYDRNRDFVKTYAPSMDILVSSNIERLFYFYYKDVNKVKAIMDEFNKTGIVKVDKKMFKNFLAHTCTNQEILDEINYEFKHSTYMIDPHTAVALNAYHKTNDGHYALVVSTASPYKFKDAILDAKLSLDYDFAPRTIKNAISNINQKKCVNKDLVKDYIDKLCQR